LCDNQQYVVVVVVDIDLLTINNKLINIDITRPEGSQVLGITRVLGLTVYVVRYDVHCSTYVDEMGVIQGTWTKKTEAEK
jgi:hypothetical protein